VHRALDLVPDRERAGPVDDLVGDRRPLDGHDLADEVREVGERPPELAGEGLEDRVGLLVGGAVVEVDRLAPVALEDVARDVGDGTRLRPLTSTPADRAAVEVIGDDGVAGFPDPDPRRSSTGRERRTSRP
jgi:hypothetical protein